MQTTSIHRQNPPSPHGSSPGQALYQAGIQISKSGFTLVELIVGMTIFSIGLAGIYTLLQTTMTTASSSRDEIIIAGLLREQIDLVNHIRDTNLLNYIPWDSVASGSTQTTFSSGFFTVESDYTATGITFTLANDGTIKDSTVKLTKLASFPADPTDLVGKWSATQLYLDSQRRYRHSSSSSGTLFSSYLIISPLIASGSEVKKDNKNQGWIIDARVMTNRGGRYNEYDARTMITDWQK